MKNLDLKQLPNNFEILNKNIRYKPFTSIWFTTKDGVVGEGDQSSSNELLRLIPS